MVLKNTHQLISNMKNTFQRVAVFFTALIVLVSAFHDTPLCCGNASLVSDNYDKCQNGQIPLPKCDRNLIFSDFSLTLKFEMNHGEKYFITEDGLMVPPPHYCMATRDVLMGKYEMLYCSSEGISNATELHVTTPNRDETPFEVLLLKIETIFCIISGSLLAITALIYFIIAQTQDVEGKCTFNLILMQCFQYFLGAFLRIAHEKDLPLVNDFCITHSYLKVFFMLSYFMWCTILLHYMWKRFRQNFQVDGSGLMNRYRIIGYGIPTLLVVICSIHVHLYSFFTKNDIERNCYNHLKLLFTFYGFLPVIILEVLCAFFFVCLQRHLWIVQPSRSPESPTSSLKRFRFRFLMVAKLFTVTGLPWLFHTFLTILYFMTFSPILWNIVRGINTFMTFEGIILFYILVVGRKYVYRGLADKFGISVRRWEQDPDSEESMDDGDEI